MCRYFKVFVLILCFNFCIVEVDAFEVVEDDYLIYLNDVLGYSYELVDGTDVVVKQLYKNDVDYSFNLEEEFVIDYSNKIYGDYNYLFYVSVDDLIVDSKNINIKYVGDNNSIINVNNIYYKNNNYYILGEDFVVSDIIDLFNDDLSLYNAKLTVLDYSNIELNDDDVVEDGYKLKLSSSYDEFGVINNISDYFTINLVGDLNKDDVIDNKDIKTLIIDDIFFDSNSLFDGSDIFDVGLEEKYDSSDILVSNIDYNNNVYVGDMVYINYYINGFDKDFLNNVIGKIEYDHDMLELVSIDINSLYGRFDSSGRFIYFFDNYNENGLFITFGFKTLAIGSSNVFLDYTDFITSGGDNIDYDMSFSCDITVLDFGKGGDISSIEDTNKDTNIKEDVIIEDNNEVGVDNGGFDVVKPTVYEELLPSKTVEHIKLSSDNYIKLLKIKGYDIKFNKDVLEYFIKVDNKVNKLKLDIVLNDNDSFYEIIGNDKFKVGNNKVIIKVTSLDGNIRNYIINVEKEDGVEVTIKENNSKNIIALLIIFIIIGLIYVIFVDDDDNK